jgi:sulfonate transport system substrate-binding protein
MNRGTFARIVFFALLVGACTRKPVPSEREGEVAREVVRVGYIGTTENAPAGAEGWAFKSGQLIHEIAKLGFGDVHFIRFSNGPDLNEALAGNALDLGIYGDTPALVGKAAGLPTRVLNQAVVGMDAFLLTQTSAVTTLDDLPGKVVATSKGSYMHRYLAALLLERHLTDRVHFAHLLPPEAQAALERGDVAAYAAPAITAPALIAKGARVLDRASAHPGLSGSTVTVATTTFLDKHPDFPRAWNAMREQAVLDLKRHPDDYYAFHAGALRVPVEWVRTAYPLALFPTEPISAGGLELLEGTKRFLVAQGLAQQDFPLDQWIIPGARIATSGASASQK